MEITRFEVYDTILQEWRPGDVAIPLARIKELRADFEKWSTVHELGPLDGSWGAHMEAFLSMYAPEYKKLDTIDKVHLSYAVGTAPRRVRWIY
jgi:hypothetical protein